MRFLVILFLSRRITLDFSAADSPQQSEVAAFNKVASGSFSVKATLWRKPPLGEKVVCDHIGRPFLRQIHCDT